MCANTVEFMFTEKVSEYNVIIIYAEITIWLSEPFLVNTLIKITTVYTALWLSTYFEHLKSTSVDTTTYHKLLYFINV